MPRERRVAETDIGALWVLFTSLLIVISDQASKFIIKKITTPPTSIPIIKGVFHLTLVFNKGAAFGILKERNIFFVLVSIACIIFMAFYFRRLKRESFLVKTAFSLILGGVLGNLIDRLRFGYVVDFLDFRIWPVFNIADSAITIGAALIIIRLIKLKTQNSKLKT